MIIDDETHRAIKAALDTLPPRITAVIRLYYGIGCDPHTMEETGRFFGVLRARCQALRDRGILSLQGAVKARDLAHALGRNYRIDPLDGTTFIVWNEERRVRGQKPLH